MFSSNRVAIQRRQPLQLRGSEAESRAAGPSTSGSLALALRSGCMGARSRQRGQSLKERPQARRGVCFVDVDGVLARTLLNRHAVVKAIGFQRGTWR